MKLLDRARIEAAVKSYDLWLDLRGARRRRRRQLRRELRANLLAAAERVGAREAVRRIGSTRQMAAEAMVVPDQLPRWYLGILAAISGLFLTLALEVAAGWFWLEGAMTAAPDRSVTGSMALFPGSRVMHEITGDVHLIGVRPGWLSLAIGLVAFVLVARPWRVLGRRRHGSVEPTQPAAAQAS